MIIMMMMMIIIIVSVLTKLEVTFPRNSGLSWQ